METPVSAQKVDHIEVSATEGRCGQSFATTIDLGELLLVSKENGAVALVTGAAADLACFR